MMINANRKEFNVTRISKDENVPFSWGFYPVFIGMLCVLVSSKSCQLSCM